MIRPARILSAATAVLLVAEAGHSAAEAAALPRLGIHPHFDHASHPGAGGAGTMRAGGGTRPGSGGGGVQRPTGGGSTHADHRLGWDDASRGPPRPAPGPDPDPGPRPNPNPPGPGPVPRPPHPYPPPPPPPPPPAWGWGPYWDWYGDDLFWGFTAGAVTGAAIAAAAPRPTVVYAPGTVVAVLPAGCSAVIVGGATYEQCGSTWFKPQYAGTAIEYVVVTPPR